MQKDIYTPPPSRKTSDIPPEEQETFGQQLERTPSSEPSLLVCIGAILLCILGYCILFLPSILSSKYESHHLRRSSE